MRAIRYVFAILLAGGTLQAQPAPMGQAQQSPEGVVASTIANLEENQTVRSLSQAVRTLQTNIEVSESVKSWVDALVNEATELQNTGNPAEARRRLVQAIAVQRELPWDEKAEFAGSLLIETNGVVDSSVPLYGQVAQSYASTYTAPNGLQLHLSLASQGTPGELVRDVGTVELASRDLTEGPWKFSARLDGVADGPYTLVAEVSDGDSVVRRLVADIVAVHDMEAQRAAIEERLAKLEGFESAKATIRYPFDYARVINIGGRELISDAGPEDPNNRFYDFSAEIRNSLALLESLESGKDPLFRAKGETQRNYEFTEAGEIMPYRVFVPSKYDGETALPFVVVLHGGGADESTYFMQRGPVLVDEAEKHGFIVVTPLGYRPGGGWGRRRSAPAARPGGAPPAGARNRSSRTTELSEKDALNVIELVANEYGVDRSRMYLMGNSMGGGGTWHLGTTYAEKWAAIAPCGSPSVGENFFPIDVLREMPTLYTQGELDRPERARTMISWAKEQGLDIPYNEVKGGTHDSAPWDNLPNIFNFFDQHRRQ